MPELKIKKIKKQTLNQMVYENIKNSILEGDLPAGAKLSEVQLAKHLNVSATPVREAFRMLAMEGLVRIDPWKGAVVQSYSNNEKLEAVQCRYALEALALELTMEKITKTELKALEYMINDAMKSEDVSDFVKISSAIHDIWIEGCCNSKLQVLMKNINDVLLHEMNISAHDQSRRTKIIAEHIEILDAMRKRDLDRAKAALKSHIISGYEYAISITK